MRLNEWWPEREVGDGADGARDVDLSSELDPLLDEEFPLGDGTADLASDVLCPYCGEEVEIALDPGSGSHQQYVEDCYVCCRPWFVSVDYQADGSAVVSVNADDDAAHAD